MRKIFFMKDKTGQQNTKKTCSKKIKTTIYTILIGCVTGIVNGLFGGGGGMILVPCLTHVLKKEPKTAHATALLIILPLSVVSGLLYASFGSFDTSVGLPVLIGATVGGGVGSLILPKISSKIVVILFAVTMLVAGGKMLFF